MKKILYSVFLLLLLYDSKAQNISFSSNGHINNFKKIDTLFFTEYKGKKPSTKTAAIDTTLSKSFLQFDSSFGFTAKNLSQIKVADSKLASFKKLFTTSFYAYSDGTLEAPTSVLFFKPQNATTVVADFSAYGKIVKDSPFNGYYYLYLNTNMYNDGDKIFALCDSLYNAGIALTIEPVFVRRIKLNTDPLFPNEWNITNTGQFNGITGADMKVANVWSLGYTGTGVKVAVIDLGVDLNHPDLQANLLPGFDATGYNSGGGPQYDEYNAHGTEVAGIIGSIQNDIGAIGVAYNAHIIPIRLGINYLDPLSNQTYINTSDSWISNCFNFAVTNGADIISNSWGGGSPSAQIDAAIDSAVIKGRNRMGTIVLFAAGNNDSTIDYPASNPNVIAVGASCECDTRKRSSNNRALLNPGVRPDPLDVSCDGEFWWGSNFGTGLDLMAPGVNISTTTFPTGTDYTNAYVINFNGTSAATPNTASVVALMLSANPNLTGQQARNILESNCDKVGGYTYQPNVSGQPNGTWCSDAGYGRVNAQAAVNQVICSA
jgi:subtilisin family serine protease